jgi:hypothetical protein
VFKTAKSKIVMHTACPYAKKGKITLKRLLVGYDFRKNIFVHKPRFFLEGTKKVVCAGCRLPFESGT